MKRSLASLALILAVSSTLSLPAAARSPGNQEVDPDSLRILWADEAHTWPDFIPQALIGDLDLTSPETVDLSHLPGTETQENSLKFFLFAEPDGPDGCFRLPIVEYVTHKERIGLSSLELLSKERLTTTGVVRKIIPGWLPGIAMPGKLIFIEVDEALRDIDQIATSGEVLVVTQISGAELVISGKRLCSSKTGAFEATVGSQVLLLGSGTNSDADRIFGQVFEIRDSMVYPKPDYDHERLKESEPIPLWKLREQIGNAAGPGR